MNDMAMPVAPGPQGLWNNLYELYTLRREKKPLEKFVDYHRTYGDIVRFNLYPQEGYIIHSPEFAQHVLRDNNHNFHKDHVMKRAADLLGMGLLTLEDEIWLKRRRLIQPKFTRQAINALADHIVEEAVKWGEGWKHKGGETLDVTREMTSLVLTTLAKTLFGADLSADVDTINDVMPSILRLHQKRVGYPRWVNHLPLPDNRKFHALVSEIDRIAYRIIDERLANPGDADDVLSVLMNARDDETGEALTRLEIHDEMMTIFIAGYEALQNALTWTWYLLSQHREAADKLRAELAQVLNGKPPRLEDLEKLPYNKMVIQESLRHHSPVWAFGRSAVGEDELGGYRIKAGATIIISVYSIHRHPAHWDNPEQFDPERFSPEMSEKRHQFAFIPFGAGPRGCIGSNMTMLESQLIMATLFQHFDLQLHPDHRVEREPLMTMRPRYGMKMIVHPL